MEPKQDDNFMMLAVQEGLKCTSSQLAFNVGAVITKVCGSDELILSKGYSREIEGNTHAEECALLKLGVNLGTLGTYEELRSNEDCSFSNARGCTIYTTMEPCSVRTSGNRSCTSRLIAAGIRRVVIGVKEPSNFVVCEGVKLLKEAGIIVDFIPTESVIKLCEGLNSHLNSK